VSFPRLAPPGFPGTAAIEARLAKLDADGFAAKLQKKDGGLWGGNSARRKVASHRLGWLEAPARFRPEIPPLREFAAETRNSGYTHAILLGMGGSSLAPEVLARSLEPHAGAMTVSVLDNTSPAAVDAAFAGRDPGTTLIVVSSKSGSTIEVSSFERAAYEWVHGALGDRAGKSFLAVTDPGTPLEALAKRRGYRRVFTNPEDIGGRYSALSLFGLVPAALMGLELDLLLDGAEAELETLGAGTPARESPGIWLGAALGELARAGRDKVTLVLPAALAALGAWIEQLLAESTGKDGRGLVPVDREDLGPPDAYGPDRVFVVITIGSPPADLARALTDLQAAGHPVISWSRPSALDLGAEFVRWEIATAVAGAVLEVNPFDEPNVAEAKLATRSLLDHLLAEGALPEPEPLAARDGMTATAPGAVAERLRGAAADPDDPLAWAAALPTLLEAEETFAVLAFLHETPARLEMLAALRQAVHRSMRAATTLGIGPRYLHSTGQLHKGGPDRAVFLQLVANEGDRPIPGEPFGFRGLQQAQSLGDYDVLSRRGRRILRLDLGSSADAGLERLARALNAGVPR
jgi:transaldolase / glucose-6-phosphate isomerase